MGCSVCENLQRTFDTRRSKYIEALSAPCYLVSSDLAASKNVDMERAKSDLEDHRLVCVVPMKRGNTANDTRNAVDGMRRLREYLIIPDRTR